MGISKVERIELKRHALLGELHRSVASREELTSIRGKALRECGVMHESFAQLKHRLRRCGKGGTGVAEVTDAAQLSRTLAIKAREVADAQKRLDEVDARLEVVQRNLGGTYEKLERLELATREQRRQLVAEVERRDDDAFVEFGLIAQAAGGADLLEDARVGKFGWETVGRDLGGAPETGRQEVNAGCPSLNVSVAASRLEHLPQRMGDSPPDDRRREGERSLERGLAPEEGLGELSARENDKGSWTFFYRTPHGAGIELGITQLPGGALDISVAPDRLEDGVRLQSEQASLTRALRAKGYSVRRFLVEAHGVPAEPR